MKIAIDGAQSSGKSTLLSALMEARQSSHFDFFGEVGSKLAQSRYDVRKSGDWQVLFADRIRYRSFILDIYETQSNLERSPNFIIDSSIYRLEAYRRFHNISDLEPLCTSCQYDVIFFCLSDFTYVDDGFRSTHGRDTIEADLLNLIKLHHRGRLVMLSGSPEERRKTAIKEIEKC